MIDPAAVLARQKPLTTVIDTYRNFDQRKSGCIKTELKQALQQGPVDTCFSGRRALLCCPLSLESGAVTGGGNRVGVSVETLC